jgi:hypothetical protein
MAETLEGRKTGLLTRLLRRGRAGLITMGSVLRALLQDNLAVLIPLVLLMLLLALVLAIVGGTGPLAPFVYPLF